MKWPLSSFLRFVFIRRALIAGGGAPEIELALRLAEYSQTLSGMEQYCFRAFSEALEVIPFTLAENAGLNPISTVTELRNRHAGGEITAGINVRKVSFDVNMCCTAGSDRCKKKQNKKEPVI